MNTGDVRLCFAESLFTASHRQLGFSVDLVDHLGQAAIDGRSAAEYTHRASYAGDSGHAGEVTGR